MKRTTILLFVALAALAGCGTGGRSGAGSPEEAAQAYVDSALHYIDGGDLGPALLQLRQAEKLLPHLDNAKTQYQICQYTGWILENTGANSKALGYMERALSYARRYGKPEYMVDVYINQANTLYNMGLNDSAWRVNLRAAEFFGQADQGQKSVILKNIAYYELLHDSLPEAEHHAYRAAMMAQDSSALGNAISLLSTIYTRQNKPQQASLLSNIAQQEKAHRMQLRMQAEYDKQVILRRQAEEKLYFSIAIIALLLVICALTLWYYSRTQALYRSYRTRVAAIKADTLGWLGRKDATIGEMKRQIDAKTREVQQLSRQLPTRLQGDEMASSIAETKLGVDVLYAILTDDNISQYGKQEQKAVTEVMKTIDRELAYLIDNPDYALTPKETFFCIMERNGKTDAQKSRSFCCSEQAVRSTKSRLSKKIDIESIRPKAPL